MARTDRSARTAWAPGLLVDRRAYEPAEVTVFSFGMAHKVRTDMFRRLRGCSTPSARSYEVYVSAANHETATLEDAEAVFARDARGLPGLLLPRQPLRRRRLQPAAGGDLLRGLLRQGRSREQHDRGRCDGDGRGRDHQPRRALASGVRPPRERDRHRAVRGAANRPGGARRDPGACGRDRGSPRLGRARRG